jgi:hypothetical protein
MFPTYGLKKGGEMPHSDILSAKPDVTLWSDPEAVKATHILPAAVNPYCS